MQANLVVSVKKYLCLNLWIYLPFRDSFNFFVDFMPSLGLYLLLIWLIKDSAASVNPFPFDFSLWNNYKLL